MRLSPQIVGDAPKVLTPEGELALILRLLQLTDLEDIGVTRDQYDVIDLTSNLISVVDNFPPHFRRLSTLLLANNPIVEIANNQHFPSIHLLLLANTKLTSLKLLHNKFPNLQYLVLSGSPIPPSYHLLAVWMFPTLKYLDHNPVTAKQRAEALEKYGDPENPKPTVYQDLNAVVDHIPETSGTTGVARAVVKKLTPAERKLLLARLLLADTIDEIDAIEAALYQGSVDAGDEAA